MAHQSAGGVGGNRLEFYVHLNQAAMHHVTSFLVHGVFEQWPALQIVLLEAGFNWAPWIADRLDSQHAALRTESPWLQNARPSEYIKRHVKFSTQPLEPPTKKLNSWRALLDTLGGIEDMLLFASDYPHWDMEGRDDAMRHLPSQWHQKVFYGNAAATYRWPRAESRGSALGDRPERVSV
jgi:predicted TIM-barrel fold metal-dependent hydrolase